MKQFITFSLIKTAVMSHLSVNKAAVTVVEDRITDAFQYFELKKKKILYIFGSTTWRNVFKMIMFCDSYFWGQFERVKNMIPVGRGGGRMG